MIYPYNIHRRFQSFRAMFSPPFFFFLVCLLESQRPPQKNRKQRRTREEWTNKTPPPSQKRPLIPSPLLPPSKKQLPSLENKAIKRSPGAPNHLPLLLILPLLHKKRCLSLLLALLETLFQMVVG